MKRYILFGGDHYYAAGGWQDFRGDFGDAEEAKADAARLADSDKDIDWWHIIDLETGKFVAAHSWSYAGSPIKIES